MNQLKDNTDADRSRVTRPRRKLLAALLVILVLPILVAAVIIARLDPNQYKPALIAAVEQATGRQLSLTGPMTIKFSLTPEIDVSGIRLSNPPGFPDPDLLTIDRVAAKIALMPLLSRHIDILQLLLSRPLIRLERDPGGQANWDFSQAQPPSDAPSPAAPAAPVNISGYKLALEAVAVEHGLLVIGSSRQATPLTLRLNALTGAADSLAAPLHLNAQAEFGTTPFSITGVVGPIARFSALGAAPWPVDLHVQMGAATAAISGTVNHPRSAQGYDLTIQANIPALEDLAKTVPAAWHQGWTLPPLHNLILGVRIADQGAALPSIEDLSITAGRSDLSDLRPGVILDSADVQMASLAAPLSVNLTGQAGNSPMRVAARFGAPETLLNPNLLPPDATHGSLPISLNAQLGAARIGVNGAITTPQTLAGVALAVNAAVPDLSAFSPLAGQTLPAWKNIQLQATVIDPGGLGLRDALGLDGLTVTMDDADFGGAASLYLSAQPRLQLALNFTRLNLDALLAAMRKPAGQTGQAPQPRATTGADANALPDIALPLKALRSASADVQVSADTLIWKQATYTALQGHAVLANGVLTINPVTGQIPGGSVMAAATLDSTKNPAAEAANLSAPALALSPFLKAFGLSDSAEGTVTAKLVATSHGNDFQAIAGGLDGQFGLAMVNGIVDGSVMDHLFGTVLHTVGLPASVVGAQGPVAVRCMAFRVDAQNGVGTIKTLTLDSSRLLVQGGGSVDFGNETLNMIVRPQLDFAGTEVGVPVQIGGSFSAPTTSVAPASAVQAAAQAAIGLPLNIAQETLGANTIFGKAASMLGAGQPGDVCPAALSLGRLGQPGPPAPPESANPASRPAQGKLSGPRNLLDTLFGK